MTCFRTEKEVKREEKVLIKKLEKNKREAKKEEQRFDREIQKEMAHSVCAPI